jgi:hypothetical protein
MAPHGHSCAQNPQPFAEIIVELEPVTGPELDHGVVGADAVTVVALEAISAREATAQKDTTGESVRSEPKLGNAWACLPSRKAATDSNSAAVTTP